MASKRTHADFVAGNGCARPVSRRRGPILPTAFTRRPARDSKTDTKTEQTRVVKTEPPMTAEKLIDALNVPFLQRPSSLMIISRLPAGISNELESREYDDDVDENDDGFDYESEDELDYQPDDEFEDENDHELEDQFEDEFQYESEDESDYQLEDEFEDENENTMDVEVDNETEAKHLRSSATMGRSSPAHPPDKCFSSTTTEKVLTPRKPRTAVAARPGTLIIGKNNNKDKNTSSKNLASPPESDALTPTTTKTTPHEPEQHKPPIQVSSILTDAAYHCGTTGLVKLHTALQDKEEAIAAATAALQKLQAERDAIIKVKQDLQDLEEQADRVMQALRKSTGAAA